MCSCLWKRKVCVGDLENLLAKNKKNEIKQQITNMI